MNITFFDKLIKLFTLQYKLKPHGLETVYSEYLQPIIAGGAIRDFYFQKKPKDYDLFYLTKTLSFDDTKNLLRKLFEKEKIHFKEFNENDERWKFGLYNDCLMFTVKIKFQIKLNEPPEEIMVDLLYADKSDINELFYYFDWNICCAAYEYINNNYNNRLKENLIKSRHNDEVHVRAYMRSNNGFHFATDTLKLYENLYAHSMHKTKFPMSLQMTISGERSLRRGIEFEKNFNVEITKNDIYRLCSIVTHYYQKELVEESKISQIASLM